ncbi:ribonuclease PH [Cellulomonas sp. ES6]|uniref:ribonuclease PH n=1 Tax=Cellulomonas sp. ES6 TaxID=3039384 RepID=UPI0019CE7AE6|nr:ribonuclease PH [Cellulomonas sp. ES6]MBD3779882.1 ribonuclease PH [Micrococcales bacterium]WHP16078.1 ribonuclease PH [Cellulomonas sp. ES6]
MKRTAVLRRLRRAAREADLSFEVVELTNHTGVVVGGVRSTLARHTEIDDVTARKFFDQYAAVLGKGWWR